MSSTTKKNVLKTKKNVQPKSVSTKKPVKTAAAKKVNTAVKKSVPEDLGKLPRTFKDGKRVIYVKERTDLNRLARKVMAGREYVYEFDTPELEAKFKSILDLKIKNAKSGKEVTVVKEVPALSKKKQENKVEPAKKKNVTAKKEQPKKAQTLKKDKAVPVSSVKKIETKKAEPKKAEVQKPKEQKPEPVKKEQTQVNKTVLKKNESEWIKYKIGWYCSKCNSWEGQPRVFCPECGRKMINGKAR